MQEILKFLRRQSGSTAIEYALIAAGVSVILLGVLFTIGGQLSGFLFAIVDAIGV